MIRSVFNKIKAFFNRFRRKNNKSEFFFKLRPYSGHNSSKIRNKKVGTQKSKKKIRARKRARIARLSRRVNRRRAAGE